MSETVRCPSCRGSKKIMGIGTIAKECATCKCTGYVQGGFETIQISPKKAIVRKRQHKCDNLLEGFSDVKVIEANKDGP